MPADQRTALWPAWLSRVGRPRIRRRDRGSSDPLVDWLGRV